SPSSYAQRKPAVKATVDFASKFLDGHKSASHELTCTTISPQMLLLMAGQNEQSPYKALLLAAKSMRIVSVEHLRHRAKYAESVDSLLAAHSSRFTHYKSEGEVSVYVRRRKEHIVEAIFVQRADDVYMLFTVITGRLTDDLIHQLLYQQHLS
ncbi:MAG: DUF4252 domain-containing protein, partial [Bacteroidales bacterium]|nr:DUF4252 domain-containing protein [Bacteroidales bacterium]